MNTFITDAFFAKSAMSGAAAAAVVTLLLASTPLSAAETPAAKKDDNSCVFAGTINDWRGLDSRNLVIWAPNNHVAYHVTLGFALTDLKSTETLGIVDGNGDGRLCGYGMDQLVITGGAYPEKSTITGMTKLDDAALAELGEKYKVNLLPKKKATK
ncbi:MAG: DUF6491 family protein [Steroidobacteraceae bacterium]